MFCKCGLTSPRIPHEVENKRAKSSVEFLSRCLGNNDERYSRTRRFQAAHCRSRTMARPCRILFPRGQLGGYGKLRVQNAQRRAIPPPPPPPPPPHPPPPP